MRHRSGPEIRGQASRQLRLLLGVCVGGMLASIAAVAWSSRASAERREEISQLRERTRVATDNWHTVHGDLDRRIVNLFDASNGSISGSVPNRALESLRSTVMELIPDASDGTNGSLIHTLNQFDRSVRATVQWRLAADAAAAQAKDDELRLTRELDGILDDVSRALDAVRQRAVHTLREHDAFAVLDRQSLETLFAASNRMIEIERVCRDVIEAVRTARRGGSGVEPDEIRDHRLGVLLSRLARLVTESVQDPDTAVVAIGAPVEDVERQLFGDGYRQSHDLDVVELGTGNYLNSLDSARRELRAGHALRADVDDLQSKLLTGVEAVRMRTLERLDMATVEAETALGQLERWLYAILGLALCGTAIVASRTSRAVRGLVDRLHGSHLEQQAMIDRLATLQAAVESADTGMIVCDPDGTARWSNPAGARLTGQDPQQLVGRRTEEFLVPISAELELPRSAPRSGRMDVRVVRGDGRERIAEQSVTSVFDPAGSASHRVVFLTDVTENRAQAESLRRALIENHMILDSITSILIVVDVELRIRTWNQHAEMVTGRTAEDVNGRRVDELGLDFLCESMRGPIEESLRNRVSRRIDDLKFNKEGEDARYLAFTIAPILSREGALHGCLLVGRDLTQLRNMQDQLTQAQKLESIGQLAAGIAHEINTPTQFVSDNTRFVQISFRELEELLTACRVIGAETADAVASGSAEALRAIVRKTDLDFFVAEIPKALEDSLAGLGRVAKIVGAMKQFSHMGTGSKELVDLNAAVQNTCAVARNEWKYVAEIAFDLQADLPRVPCLPAEMAQVFLNIVVNAAHAMQGPEDAPPTTKGRISITTRATGGWVEVRISDTGSGIPESIRRRIYDPFFTTKGVGKGTGQGLAIARSIIVDRHGGTIGCESEVGKGTTFVLRLPLVNIESQEAEEVAR